MSKHSIFTTVTPLPPTVSREGVLAFLHDYEAIIDLNSLVIERHRIPAPTNADPDEALRVWYQLTDAIAMPWQKGKGKKDGKTGTHVSYTCVFHPLPDGLQTHCRAPLGVDIRDRWSIGGTMPGEPRQPVELGLSRLGAPATGLYLREDVDLRCNRFITGFVKKTLRRSHADLVVRLASAASTASSAVPIASAPRTVSQNSNGSSNCSSNRSSRSITSTTTITTSSTSCTPLPPPPPLPPLSASPPVSSPYPTPYVLPRYQPQHPMSTQPEHRPHFPVQHRTASPDLSRSVTATPQPPPPPPPPPHPQPLIHSQDKATNSEYQLQPLTYKVATNDHKDTRSRPHLPPAQKQLEIPPPAQQQPTSGSPDSASTDGKNPYYRSPIYAELTDGALPPVPVVLDTGARSRERSRGRSREARRVAMK